ncbi:RNA-directed DNA polymerase from mobile element jockey [Araneus ventricosus]|uniref:RNA-directed DNA polymerase from mobile element jockey n=1 Tax=Araneus ventricosus TaxID=182803 RepID=A0A4Y2TWG9_ARAVE|nr:RNA-directed DNA polymerase from mobile element jockey [Araneus ventricosus]
METSIESSGKDLISDVYVKASNTATNVQNLTCMDEKFFTPDVCSKESSQKSNLNEHYQTHSNERPFSCVVCGKEFCKKKNLNLHFRIHAKEKPFLVIYAPSSFCTKTNREPYNNRHISEVNKAVHHFLKSTRNDNYIKLTSPLEIQAIIKKINPNKAIGPDGMPNKAHKMILPNLLTCITKIYEKVILARLKELCSNLQIIPEELYRFRPNHGCLHQLLRVTNLITHGFNNKLYTVGVFLDVRKEFDNGIIYKLIANKLPHYLIDIIILFLRNRTFKVKLNSTLSETGHIKAGTPQGSILRLFLYTVHTSDFPMKNHIINFFFADDTAILAQGSTTKFVIRTLQRGLIEIGKIVHALACCLDRQDSNCNVRKDILE